MADKCLDHMNFTGAICPDCGLEVDDYGNTEEQFDHCSFPDCGCDGARLCYAGEASERAERQNVEGMWSLRTRKQKKAVLDLYGSILRDKKP